MARTDEARHSMDEARIVAKEPKLSDQERENLKNVFRKTDEEAEKMDRRDCLRVQEQVQEMRKKFGIDE